MDIVRCGDCQRELSEPNAHDRPSCPYCGSRRRHFSVSVSETLRLHDHFSAVQSRADEVIGFFESKGQKFTRSASLEPDGTIEVRLEGLPPQNEQDGEVVLQVLLAHMEDKGERWFRSGDGSRDDDFLIQWEDQALHKGVQVVRAMTDPLFWRTLLGGDSLVRRLTMREAATAVIEAIGHKARPDRIPPGHRERLILVLDALRVPGLALTRVAMEVRALLSVAPFHLGFFRVYLVGPGSQFVHRLDSSE